MVSPFANLSFAAIFRNVTPANGEGFLYIKNKVCVCIHAFSQRCLGRFEPNFVCRLSSTQPFQIRNIFRIEPFLDKICEFFTPRTYKSMHFRRNLIGQRWPIRFLPSYNMKKSWNLDQSDSINYNSYYSQFIDPVG